MAERTRAKSRGRALVWLVIVGVAVFAAVKTGWAGYGWAHVRASVYPRNDALLQWLPPDTTAVAILDPHQIHPSALGSNESVVRTWIERVRADVKKAAGVDLAFDVDKIALTPTLVVMSGRFDGEKLATKLADYQYVRADYNGRMYLVRAGEDAVMPVDDETLVYGDEASIKAAVDAKNGASLARDDQVVDRLARIGWNQPLLGTVTLGGARPSLRAMISGSTGPRAISFGVSGGQGIALKASVDAATPSAANELATLLEEKRRAASDTLAPLAGASLAPLLVKVAQDATIHSDGSGQVLLTAHLSNDALDAIARAAGTSTLWTETYKAFRLYQLLAPSH